MKSILIFIALLSTLTAKNLKQIVFPLDSSVKVTSLNPQTIKSPGEFSNVAPESNEIITPRIACKYIHILSALFPIASYTILITIIILSTQTPSHPQRRKI
jgi:hypothetical protein